VSNMLLILMFLLFVIPSTIYKMYFLALAFVIFGLVFGFMEFLAHFYTQHTISQQLWDLIVDHQIKGVIILVCMLLGWICLLLHLGIRFK